MDQFPVYIRFEPGEGDHAEWCLEEVEVRVNPVAATPPEAKKYAALVGPANYLWFAKYYGKYLALFPVTSTTTPTTTTTTTTTTIS